MVNREITEIGKAVCFKIEVIISALSFGAVEVDICIPNGNREKNIMNPRDYFSQMGPIFLTENVGIKDIGKHMRTSIKQNELCRQRS